MRISTNIPFADAKEERRQGERGFTMVEIAIAIGVIGFALVAVIGILPAGMNVQKDNREDTMISEDAPIFLDAIRNGATVTNFNGIIGVNGGLDYLTNYVEKIEFVNVVNGVMTVDTSHAITSFEGGGAEIVGLLTTPSGASVGYNNYTFVRAIVRAISGSAVQQNGSNTATAFRYQMDVQMSPFVSISPDLTNYLAYNSDTNSPDYTSRYYKFIAMSGTPPLTVPPVTPWAYGSLGYNLFDLRLHFSWPVIDQGANQVVGPGRQNYRTMISSGLVAVSPPANFGLTSNLWYFQPQQYATSNQQNL